MSDDIVRRAWVRVSRVSKCHASLNAADRSHEERSTKSKKGGFQIAHDARRVATAVVDRRVSRSKSR
jgi:hypothetical protein